MLLWSSLDPGFPAVAREEQAKTDEPVPGRVGRINGVKVGLADVFGPIRQETTTTPTVAIL
jgi:hypothetical protein